jgi:hypothetical protein
MCFRLWPVRAQPDAGRLDVGLTEDQKNSRRSMARNRLLKDKTIHRPDLVVAVFLASRLRLGVVGVMMRVG